MSVTCKVRKNGEKMDYDFYFKKEWIGGLRGQVKLSKTKLDYWKRTIYKVWETRVIEE